MHPLQIFSSLFHWLAQPDRHPHHSDDPFGHPDLAGMTLAELSDLPLPRPERAQDRQAETEPPLNQCA